MPKKNISPLGRKLRELLRQNQISGRELGRRLRVSTGTVSNWCFDTWPGIDEVKRLAEFFRVPVQSLLVGYEAKYPGMNREIFSSASRAVRKALAEQGLAVDKISGDQYDQLVMLAYARAMSESLQGTKTEDSQDALNEYLADLVQLVSADR